MAGRRATRPNDLARLLVQRINARDLEGIVDLYDADAVIDTANGSASGHAAIRALWERFLATGPHVELGRQTEALVNGDLAVTSTRLPDGRVTAEVARRQPDGSWRWLIDQPDLPTDPPES